MMENYQAVRLVYRRKHLIHRPSLNGFVLLRHAHKQTFLKANNR